MRDETYGKKFRRIRKLKRLSLVKASTGVISKSSLARWELGYDNLSWGNVLKLLDQNNIYPVEFIENRETPYLGLNIKAIQSAFVRGQTSLLKKYALDALKSCKLDPLNEKVFFKAAVACDLYKKHTNKSICPKRVQVKLRLYFSNIIAENDYWNYENIFFFKNVVMLLNGKEAYKFAYDLLDYAKQENLEQSSFRHIVLQALLEATNALLRKNIIYAKKILFEVKSLIFSDYDSLEKIEISFLDSVIKFIEEDETAQLKALYNVLDYLEMKDLKYHLENNIMILTKLYKNIEFDSQIWEK
ncbi:helix-turn-helix transcriptional regulator [Lactobacillus sp.]|uniref:helix-turn-helix domain-containing protein n=1 Tax=Lactobacillus sp. TaxID=1591 RepID=UPI0025EE80B9|nr:helix-turn-helix transcriptional regulator [Lactobacillus sp.]MCO6536091.1 helix-turn-helix transcriptional regulator [Lactobacillus sp.]